MPNLHSCAAAFSYKASYPWTIPKPALIKNYAKVLAITKEFPFFGYALREQLYSWSQKHSIKTICSGSSQSLYKHNPWMYPSWTARNTVNKNNQLNPILQKPSNGRRRPSGNEPSQDKEPMNCLVQQAKLSLFS